MKKILVSCLLLIPAWGIAQEPTEQEIRKAATNYMVLFAEGSSGNITKIHPDMQQKGTPAYQREALIHVLEFRGGGWIIMSNDYRVQPVLAYSPHGTWNPDTSQMPSGLIGLLSHYMAEINLTKSRKPSGSSEEKLFWLQNSEKWKGLQDANSVYLKSLIQSKAQSVDNLLNQGSRGSVAWGQSCNASKIFITPQGDYAPRYNKFAPARDESVTVTVNYIKVSADEDDTVKSEEELMLSAKSQANKIFDEYNSGTKTEAAFKELLVKYDDGDNELISGDVFEDMKKDGSHDSAVENWAYDSSRKAGDTAVLEGDGCYYIVYFSSKADHPVWYETILSAVYNNAVTSWQEEFVKSYEDSITKDEEAIAEAIEYINSMTASMAS